MAFGVPRHPRPASRNDHLQVVRVVRAIAQLAFQAPRPHFEPGAATDIEAGVKALERFRILSGKRAARGMSLIRDVLQLGPAALDADIEAAGQYLRVRRRSQRSDERCRDGHIKDAHCPIPLRIEEVTKRGDSDVNLSSVAGSAKLLIVVRATEKPSIAAA